jgi:hypothetical protein
MADEVAHGLQLILCVSAEDRERQRNERLRVNVSVQRRIAGPPESKGFHGELFNKDDWTVVRPIKMNG